MTDASEPTQRSQRRLRLALRLFWLLVAAAAAAAGGSTAASSGGSSTAAAARSDAAAVAGTAEVGPGAVAGVYHLAGFSLALRDSPNRASKAGRISVALTLNGAPVAGAQVKVTLTMLDMPMGSLSAVLPQMAAGRYARPTPILGMGGRWQIALEIRPRGGPRLHLAVVDRVAH